jgi:2-keto-4-pentenoate hydratase/2-oxohepta-3-ene-1,7-dioic acid hydratase in catechol pathway
MRFARFAHADGASVGVVEGDVDAGQNALTVAEIEGSMFGQFRFTGNRWAVADVRLLPPPLFTSKIVCVGRNYAEHAAEMANDVPKEPLLFLKPSTSLIGAHDTIEMPPQSSRVDHEAELAAVIGGSAGVRRLDRAAAAKAIFGYTVANDVTARDLQVSDGQWTRAKGFDTFCPLGPWIETEIDVSDLEVRCEVNDEVRQLGNTKDMVFDAVAIVSYVSHMMTLLPGDVILTGTPAGVSPLASGDVVSVRVQGIGELINPVRARED